MSNRAPAFLNKPIHSGTVVATARGWVVEETGELLVSVKGLDRKISEYLGTVIALTPPVLEEIVAPVIAAPVIEAPAAADLESMLAGLPDSNDGAVAIVAEAPVIAPVADAVVVAEAPAVAPVADAVPAEPEVVKPRRGRPPKVRPEAEAAK